MNPHPCVGSGMCCKSAPCGYGKWNDERTQCAHLEEEYRNGDVTIYKCGLHDYIVQQVGADLMPAFGAGCCQPLFNEAREHTIKVIRAGTDAGALGVLLQRLRQPEKAKHERQV